MRRADVSETQPEPLVAALAASYGLDVTAIRRADRGQDPVATTWVATDRAERRYLVKVRPAIAPRSAAAAASAALRDAGLPLVVAPLRTRSGSVTATVADRSLTVFPFVDAAPAMHADGLTASQWRALGAFARRLHGTTLPRPVAQRLPVETYRPPELALVPGVDAAAPMPRDERGPAAEVAGWWRAHRPEILALAQRTEELAAQLRARSLPLVVCHADLHTGNVLAAPDGRLWVVDWDELVWAPRERDLMFVIGGISEELVRPADTSRFLEGYGQVAVDGPALAYYRHAWAIQDVAGYAHRVLVEEHRTPEERAEAAAIFLGLFRPGEIVDLARRGER